MGKAHTKMDEKAIPKNDSYGALRYRTSTSPTSELLAAALRYRPPHPQKAIALRYSKKRSPSHILKKRTACSSASLSPPHIPKKAIALPHLKSDRTSHIQNSDRTSTPQKSNCLQQRFAIALPHPPKSELLAAALRYRPLTSPKSIALSHPQKRSHLPYP
jgi:hypothetical protein